MSRTHRPRKNVDLSPVGNGQERNQRGVQGLRELSQILTQRHESLRALLRDQITHLQGDRESRDTVDAANHETAQGVSAQLAELEGRELEKVEQALQRIRQGTYGKCEECMRRISLDRLRALPYSSLCVRCQREEEMSGDGGQEEGEHPDTDCIAREERRFHSNT